MEILLRALQETLAQRLLLDLWKMRLVLVDDERWLAQVFLPELAMTSLQWMAVVTPENASAGVIVADLAKGRPTGTVSKHCGTLGEART